MIFVSLPEDQLLGLLAKGQLCLKEKQWLYVESQFQRALCVAGQALLERPTSLRRLKVVAERLALVAYFYRLDGQERAHSYYALLMDVRHRLRLREGGYGEASHELMRSLRSYAEMLLLGQEYDGAFDRLAQCVAIARTRVSMRPDDTDRLQDLLSILELLEEAHWGMGNEARALTYRSQRQAMLAKLTTLQSTEWLQMKNAARGSRAAFQ